MPVRRRRFFRTVLTLLILVVLPTILTHSSALHRALLTTLARTAGASIRFDKSRLSFLIGRIRLEKVTVTHKAFQFQSEALSLSVSPLSLFRGQLILSHLFLDHPVLTLPEAVAGPVETQRDREWLKMIFARFEKSLLLRNLILEEAEFKFFKVILPEGASPVGVSPVGVSPDGVRPVREPITGDQVILSLKPTFRRKIEGRLLAKNVNRGRQVLESLESTFSLSPSGLNIRKFRCVKGGVQLIASGEWKGSLEEGALNVTVELLLPEYLNDPIRTTMMAKVKRKVARIESLDAQFGQATFKGQGILNGGAYALRFKASSLPVESIFGKLKSVVLSPARGVAEVEGMAEGVLPQIRIRASATISNFRHNSLTADELLGDLRLDWPLFSFGGKVRTKKGGPDNGDFQGSVSFERRAGAEKLLTYPGKIEVSLEEAPLSEFVPSFGVEGLLSGALHLTGQGVSVEGKGEAEVRKGKVGILDIERLATRLKIDPGGNVVFEGTQLELPNLEPIYLSQPIDLVPQGNRFDFSGAPSPQIRIEGSYHSEIKQWEFKRLEVRSGKGLLVASGTVSDLFNVKIKGPWDLSGLRAFRELVGEADGYAQVDLHLTGLFKNPEVRGKMEVRNAVLELRSVGEILSDIAGELLFKGHLVHQRVSGRLGNGSFASEGETEFAFLQPTAVDLKIRGEGIPFRYRRDFNLQLSGAVGVKGPVSAPHLSGEIEIVEGRYRRPFVIQEFVLKPLANKNEGEERGSLPPATRLDLKVTSAGELEIKNNVAQIYLSCDLALGGTIGSPHIEGAMSLLEGKIRYLNSDFTLVEGRMEFADPTRSEPHFLLRGEQEIPPDYLVTMKVEGYLSNLEITLTSVPSRDPDDILSLIAFGKTRDELERSGGLGSRLGQQIAWQTASQPIEEILEGLVPKIVPIDVSLAPSASGSVSGGRLSVGGTVTDRLSFELKTDFAPDTAERTFQANYYLTDRVLLKGIRTRSLGLSPRYQFNLSLRFQVR